MCSYRKGKDTVLKFFRIIPVEGCCYRWNSTACLPLVSLATLIPSDQMWWHLLCVVPSFLEGLYQSCQRLICLFSLACNGGGLICNQRPSRPLTTVKYYIGKLSRCLPWSRFHQNDYAPTGNI